MRTTERVAFPGAVQEEIPLAERKRRELVPRPSR